MAAQSMRAAAAALGLALAATPGHAEPAVTYHRADVEGVSIFYREAGSRDAPTIVLLHGYPSSSRMYGSLIPLLAKHYHLVAPDYPGFGQSEAPPPSRYAYTFDHLAGTVDALLGHLRIERYVLFMQDYGGPVGYRIAMRRPERVRGIIVQNANAYSEGLGAKWNVIARYWSDRGAHEEQLTMFMSLEGAEQRHIGSSPQVERYDPNLWTDEFAFLSRPGQREIQGDLLYDYRTNVESYPLWQAWLREKQPPALILWGRHDPSFIVPGALAYARDLPNAEIHILDAGHFVLDERPKQAADLVRKFMRRLP